MAAGRPRAFCTDEALDKALTVFWEKGYEGASLQDLTKAMGINRPSLYAAFGNKESLFLKAMDRYAEKNSCMIEFFNEPTAREAIEKLLYKLADKLSDPDTPHGCVIVIGALACKDETAHIREELISRRLHMQLLVQQRLERAQKEGDFPASVNPAAYARYISALSYGLSVQATSGTTREQLREVVTTALTNWPTLSLE